MLQNEFHYSETFLSNSRLIFSRQRVRLRNCIRLIDKLVSLVLASLIIPRIQRLPNEYKRHGETRMCGRLRSLRATIPDGGQVGNNAETAVSFIRDSLQIRSSRESFLRLLPRGGMARRGVH